MLMSVSVRYLVEMSKEKSDSTESELQERALCLEIWIINTEMLAMTE